MNTPEQTIPTETEENIKIIELPEIYKQTPMFCGPTCLRIVFRYYDIQKTEEELAEMCQSSRETGTDPQNMVQVAQELGLRTEYMRESSIDEVRSLTSQGIPVIVDWFSPEQAGHYSVIIGVGNRELIMAEPLTGSTRRMTIKDFLNHWFELDSYPPKDPSKFTLREMIVIQK